MNVYNDVGGIVTTLNCILPANAVLRLGMYDLTATGSLVIEGQIGGSNCLASMAGFHGVYHMKVWQTESGQDLAVSVNAWADAEQGQLKKVMGAYQAHPAFSVAYDYVLPAVLTQRGVSPFWDTEIVVQNVGLSPQTITFSWRVDGEGTTYSNNSAVLASNERRSFLASQLMYAVGANGTLVEKSGWAWMRVSSTGGIAVITNLFQQSLNGVKNQAEKGSNRFMQFENPRASTNLVVPGFTVNGTASLFRISNLPSGTATIVAKLYDGNGNQVGSTVNDSLEAYVAKNFASSVFGAANGTYTLRVTSSQNIVVSAWGSNGGGHYGVTAQQTEAGIWKSYLPFYWSNFYTMEDILTYTLAGSSADTDIHFYQRLNGTLHTYLVTGWTVINRLVSLGLSASTNQELYGYVSASQAANPMSIGKFESYDVDDDRLVAYAGITKSNSVWYVPFAPAPVVQFVETPPYYPKYGLPTPHSSGVLNRGDTPVWTKGMTWYDWGASNCDNSYYVPMNSQIRNSVPSRCVGRPLLLVNEPELSDQANMTDDEVARHAFYHRGWPGKLFSPAYNCIRPDGQNCLGYAFSQGIRSLTFNAHKTLYENVWGTLPYDGLATHQYVYRPTAVGSGSDYRSGLQQFKNLANSYGWEIWVTEFGWYPWDVQGSYYVNEQYIADNIGNLADAISAVLVQGRLMYFSQSSCWETNPPSDRSCKRYPYQTQYNPDYNAWGITQMFAYDHTGGNGNPNWVAANWTCPDSNGDGKCDLTAPVGNAWKSYMDLH